MFFLAVSTIIVLYSGEYFKTIMMIRKFLQMVSSVHNWPRTLMDHLGVMKGSYICRLRNGYRFNVRGNSDDRHVIFEVLIKKIYPMKIKQGSIVVDIGAHIGCFTIHAARPAVKVFSYEPFPENFNALVSNLKLNNISNVNVFLMAVSGKRGTQTLFIPDNESYSGRYSLYPGRGTRTIKTKSITLDDVFKENNLHQIDLLKIDCQGAEYEILYSTNAKTYQKIQVIVVECEVFQEKPGWSLAGLKTYLEQAGFQVAVSENILCAENIGISTVKAKE